MIKDLYTKYAVFVQRFLPFGNAPPLVIILVVFILLFFLPFMCSGAELEFSAGSTYVRGPASVIGVKAIVPDVVSHVGDAACGLMLIGTSDYRGEPQRTQAAVQCQIISHVKRLNVGLGVAVLQHEDAYNGGKFNFSLMIQLRAWRELYITLDQHLSNSASADPNLGRDMALLSWRFK